MNSWKEKNCQALRLQIIGKNIPARTVSASGLFKQEIKYNDKRKGNLYVQKKNYSRKLEDEHDSHRGSSVSKYIKAIGE